MVPWLEALAEQKIRDAMERGEFTDLPGQGVPLDLRSDPLVPQEVLHRLRASGAMQASSHSSHAA